MFENFGTAIVQAVGFFGVFGFFVYQLISEKKPDNSSNNDSIRKSTKPTIKSKPKKSLFSRNKKIEVKPEPKKKGWFSR